MQNISLSERDYHQCEHFFDNQWWTTIGWFSENLQLNQLNVSGINDERRLKKCSDVELRRKTLNEIESKESLYPKRLSKEELDDLSRLPDPQLEVGQTLPKCLKKRFPKELIGKPIEEIDPYYAAEEVSSPARRQSNIHPYPIS